ncbi:50S ribosome-binding GTPase [Brachybacterium sp. EF45031]|uniref:sulfate adenylyltransferase subunit 1 n=1 Tax=Brachybacterium sillae TaxID=2810536 RepID=UPI00217E0539|nr:GTP-binding protein [Brachybacterium sillae]MCS6710875.1 50S ribosome-binding GTPase [Brachybacterium sillae]
MTTNTAERDTVTTSSPGLLRIATAGSVDDGKSTLLGRLLHDTKSVFADQLAAVEAVSRQRGWQGELADLALLTDGLRAEREQGITIDVAHRYFATPTRSFVLADTPGHVQYTRNMVTGASTADVVVLLVDARHGVVEQTRRHLAVTALLRVPQVVVTVNKIDLVEDAEDVLATIAGNLRDAATALGVDTPHVVPISALHGDNVVTRSERTPWYDGPTLLELLESLPPRTAQGERPLRLPVQLVIRPQHGAVDPSLVDYRAYAGLISSGTVRVGDEVEVAASGLRSRVTGIDVGPEARQEASAGESVSLRLADQLDISRGDLLAAAGTAPQARDEIQLVLAHLAEDPLRPGARVLVKHGTRPVQARVLEIDQRLDIERLEVVPAEEATLNDLVRARLLLAEPLPVEDYAVDRDGGALLVIDPASGRTLDAGMVGSALRA